MPAYPNIANEKQDVTNKQVTPPVKDPAPNHPPAPPHHEPSTCASLPDFKRLNYFYGQLLGVADFQTEQNYFREKLKLHNRCLHGYGVICGLKVVPEPGAEECSPEIDKEVKEIQAKMEELRAKWNEVKRRADAGDQAAREELVKIEQELEELRRKRDKLRTEECDEETPTRVIIECGLALDCDGNELVAGHDLPVDLWRHLDRVERQRITDGEHTIYLSICYCEQPADPARPVLPDACGATSECNYGKLRDSVKVRVTVDPPEADERCATCCAACKDSCLLLARIDDFYRGRPLLPEDIHNEVRRPLASYVPTTITGISWTDGAEYTEDEAEGLLGVNPHNLKADDTDRPKGYLLVTFSRRVLTATLKRGVIDIWSIQGGGGRMADIFSLDVEYVDLPDPAKESTTDRVRFRVTTDESPNPGDRVMIFVRAPRILDECCRPVDGAHTGGRVPFVDDQEFKDYRRDTDFVGCIWPPPFGYGPWTSGTGSPGANFESWFYIKPNPKGESKKK